MKALKKKQVVLTALVAMIGLAGYFNWMYENSDNGSVTDSDEVALGEARLVSGTNIKEDYFQKSRLERDTGRSKAIENLKTVSENPESDPETKKEAEEKLIEMAGRTEKEAAAEGEICAKGFSDCVVYLSDSSASVIVQSDSDITGSDAAKIQEIVIRIAGVDSSEISISSYKK